MASREFIDFHINWKRYVRNRLLELLRRLGAEKLFRNLDYLQQSNVSVASLVSQLDFAQQSFFYSMERYALERDEAEQMFRPDVRVRVPFTDGVDPFADTLHTNFEKIIEFIRSLTDADLNRKIHHPTIRTPLSIGWLLQYTTLHEQAVISGIQKILQYNDVDIRVPWATESFMRPVKRLRLKSSR